jgi:glycosyltransferase involved in cell wall biosynthesis
LRSVYAQSLLPDEVIVVDDGSPDNTAHLVAEHFPKVKLIQQENQGYGTSRNRVRRPPPATARLSRRR